MAPAMDDNARKQSPKAPRSTLARAATAPLGRAPWESPRVLLAVLATVLAFPALLLVPRTGAGDAEAVSTGADAAASASASGIASTSAVPTSALAAPTTSLEAPTTAAPTTAAPTTAAPTTAAPTTVWTPPTTQWVPPTTQWVPPTTAWTPPPTTAAPVVTAPPPPPAPANQESGQATWYDWRPGECAHKTIPKGTVVTIHASNGNTATCVVTDRGPFAAGRIIDLDRGVFSQLASTGTGVIYVTITW